MLHPTSAAPQATKALPVMVAEAIAAVTAVHRATKALRVTVAATPHPATRALRAIAAAVEAARQVTAPPAAEAVEDRAGLLVVEAAVAAVEDGLQVEAVGRVATARPG
jgi:hypothetical protein